MPRPGWNLTRRNRNIGTERQGHGQDNQLVIPEAWWQDRVYYERLKDPVIVRRCVDGKDLTFFVEPPHTGWAHACTVDDIAYMLQFVPSDHLEPFQSIVLRQPKGKEKILATVWGRLAYWAGMGRYSGPAVFIEACPVPFRTTRSRSLRPDQKRELERLRTDGHRVTLQRRGYVIESTVEAIRSTQLYRTVLHEIGHYADYLTHCEAPMDAAKDDAEAEQILDVYFAKPSADKEAFAHGYADELAERLRGEGSIPFAGARDEEAMRRSGMEPAWFGGADGGDA